MCPIDSDLFEMRRLESLSNTVFGVAVTLLAYGLPQAAHFDHVSFISSRSSPACRLLRPLKGAA